MSGGINYSVEIFHRSLQVKSALTMSQVLASLTESTYMLNLFIQHMVDWAITVGWHTNHPGNPMWSYSVFI